jgi:hypothetical protein
LAHPREQSPPDRTRKNPMKRTTFRLSAFALTIASFLGACTLIAEVDRSKIAVEEVPDGMGGVTGTGGDGLGGADGTGGDGGAGGDAN